MSFLLDAENDLISLFDFLQKPDALKHLELPIFQQVLEVNRDYLTSLTTKSTCPKSPNCYTKNVKLSQSKPLWDIRLL